MVAVCLGRGWFGRVQRLTIQSGSNRLVLVRLVVVRLAPGWLVLVRLVLVWLVLVWLGRGWLVVWLGTSGFGKVQRRVCRLDPSGLDPSELGQSELDQSGLGPSRVGAVRLGTVESGTVWASHGDHAYRSLCCHGLSPAS